MSDIKQKCMEYLLIIKNVTLFNTRSEKLPPGMKQKDFVKHHEAFKCS